MTCDTWHVTCDSKNLGNIYTQKRPISWLSSCLPTLSPLSALYLGSALCPLTSTFRSGLRDYWRTVRKLHITQTPQYAALHFAATRICLQATHMVKQAPWHGPAMLGNVGHWPAIPGNTGYGLAILGNTGHGQQHCIHIMMRRGICCLWVITRGRIY